MMPKDPKGVDCLRGESRSGLLDFKNKIEMWYD